MSNKIWLTVAFALGSTFVCGSGNAAELNQPVTRMKSPSGIHSSPTAAIIPCPDKLTNVNVSIDSQYSAPGGWTPKSFPTGYQSQTLVVSYHSVMNNQLYCTYAQTSLPSSYRLTTINKPVPAGKSCSVIEGFKFSCQ
jgi:hypothetical protein